MKKRKRRMRTGKGSTRNQRIRRNRRLLALTGIVTAFALVFVTVLVVTLLKNVYNGDDSEPESFLETIEVAHDTTNNGKHEYLNQDIINFITGSGMTVTEARKNLFGLVDEVADEHRGYCIVGKRNQAVLLSMEDWNAIQESLYLNGFPGLADSIVEGMKTPVSECSTELKW